MSEHPTKSMGKVMIFAAWLVLLGLLYFLFDDILEKQFNPNQNLQSQISNQGVVELKLQRNRYGHYVTPGKINGHDVVFLLDTGATRISIPEPTAQRIGLKRGIPMAVSTANGTIEVYHTRLHSMSIGRIQFENLSASINPYMDNDSILLGMNALKQLEMIQRGETLTLRQYPGR